MKLDHSYNYFISMNLYMQKKAIYIIIFIFFSSALSFFNCGSDRKKQNELKREECLRLSYLAFTESQNSSQNFSDSEKVTLTLDFAYSCSAESGQSPSCKEFYSRNKDSAIATSICEPSFLKKIAKCPTQNLIGSCFIFQADAYEKILYAQPNDSLDISRVNCAQRNGKFIAQEISNLSSNVFLSCELIRNDN